MFCTCFVFGVDEDIVVMKIRKHRKDKNGDYENNKEVQWIRRPHVETSWSRKKQAPKGTTENPSSRTYTLKGKSERFKTHKGIRRK